MDLYVGNSSLFAKDQSLMDLLEDRNREQNLLDKLSIPKSQKSTTQNFFASSQQQKLDPQYQQQSQTNQLRTLNLIKSNAMKRPESQNLSKKSSVIITSPNNANSQIRMSNDTFFLQQQSNTISNLQLISHNQSQQQSSMVDFQLRLEQKDRELQLLTRKNQEMKIELQVLKSRQQKEPKSYFNLNQESIESPEFTIEAINRIYMMCDQTLKSLQQRVKLLQSMISLLDEVKQEGKIDKKEIFNLKKGIVDMSNVAVEVSKNELDANYYYRQLQKIQLDHSNLKVAFDKLAQRCELLEQKLHQTREKCKEADDDNLNTHKNLRLLDQKYQDQEKKVDSLNKRIDILKGQQIIKDKDKIKQILEDLLKENEHLKKNVFSREQYIVKLQMNINQLKDKNGRLLKKLKLLKNQQKKNNGGNGQDDTYEGGGNGGYDDDDMYDEKNDQYLSETRHQNLVELSEQEANRFLERNSFPQNLHIILDANIRSEYASLLKDVQDSGTFLGIDAIVNAQDAQEKLNIITAITEIFRITKTWLDDQNYFSKLLIEMQELNSLDDIQVYAANNLRKLLECDSAHLWMVDSQLGCFYTFTENRQKLQAYLQHELFGDMTRFKQTIMMYAKSNLELFRNIENDEKKIVEGAILVPLVSTPERVEIFLEISQFSNRVEKQKGFPLHTGYFVFLATQFFRRFLLKKKQYQMLQGELRYRDFFFDSFIDLCRSNDLPHFVRKVNYWAENIFGVHSSQLLLVDKTFFLVWEEEKQAFRQAKVTLGLAGMAAKLKQSQIVMNCKNNNNFHHEVDLDTVFPVYLIPIFKTVNPNEFPTALTSETSAVLQIALNSRSVIKDGDMKDNIEIQNYFKPSECVEIMANHFTTSVSMAFYYFELKQSFAGNNNNKQLSVNQGDQ